MADTAEQRAALVMMLRAHGVRDRRVLGAFETIPRAAFLPAELKRFAHHNGPLPLPCGQTMEKPSHAARLIEALQVEPEHHVVEIGTGSGWLTAVLASLAVRVISFERYNGLENAASHRLNELDIHNATVSCADGLHAFETLEDSPEKVFLNASLENVPKNLLQQMKPRAVLLTAIGPARGPQKLTRFTRSHKGAEDEDLGEVRLMPLESCRALVL